MLKLSIASSMTILLVTSSAMAGGPLYLFDPATKTPYTYPGPINLYTDNDAFFSNTGPITNASADARVADAAAQWTGVATSSLAIAVAGDFASLGLPDIVAANVGLVYGFENGPGYHVIYDSNGEITAALAGPGVLGFSSPEWAETGTANITESFAVLNGTTVEPGDTEGIWWQGVVTHEMGHGINLAHAQLNGAVGFFGDDIGPTNCAPPYTGTVLRSHVETMYPFIDPSVGTGTGPEQGTVDILDDMASVSDLYPAAGWPSDYGTVSGTIYKANGTSELTGVNVIVRNIANPFGDCSSMISGAFSQGDAGPDGHYEFNGLTPGQTYVVYVDEIAFGGFSTQPVHLPGKEEFYNGALESFDFDIDDRCDYTALQPAAGQTIDADIIFNLELNLGDDDAVEVPLPFTFNMCGTDYDFAWVGSNGYVTFGAPATNFFASVSELLSGPSRIAMLWDDLNPEAGGTITARQVGANFVITFEDVPEYAESNSNSFALTLRPDHTFNIDYPAFDAVDGLVGMSIGNRKANNPGEIDLSAASEPIAGDPGDAVYEQFNPAGNDLSGDNLEWAPCQDYDVIIAPAPAGVIYATSGAASLGSLYTIDPSTGLATFVGLTGIGGITGLAINSQGEIWGTERTTGSLFRLDAVTGAAYFQTASDTPLLDAIAFDANDVLYGIGFDPPQFQLRTIDTSTGTTTPIGPTGDTFEGLAFHPTTGVLYGAVGGLQPANPDGIATIDTSNGATTYLGVTGLGGATQDLAFGPLASLYGVKGEGQSNSTLILVSQSDGAGTIVGSTNYPFVSGMASRPETTNPTLLQAFAANAIDDGVTLTWEVHTSGDDLLGFRVHRRDVGGVSRVVTDTPLAQDVRSFVDGSVVPGKSYVYRLEIVDSGGEFYSPEIEVRVNDLELELAQNKPNPFNPTTTIGYTVPSRSRVALHIYDVAGRLVARLVDEERAAGRYSVVWNGRSGNGDPVGSGVYFYRLTAGNDTLTRKMVLLK
jgi:hypothetical protein